ncbi:MAG: hypothetical protein JPMHGGIA_00717 [Saprospiraceae bacterium]|nr:hypothetical protein [Saprospiraceae bacterium]
MPRRQPGGLFDLKASFKLDDETAVEQRWGIPPGTKIEKVEEPDVLPRDDAGLSKSPIGVGDWFTRCPLKLAEHRGITHPHPELVGSNAIVWIQRIGKWNVAYQEIIFCGIPNGNEMPAQLRSHDVCIDPMDVICQQRGRNVISVSIEFSQIGKIGNIQFGIDAIVLTFYVVAVNPFAVKSV